METCSDLYNTQPSSYYKLLAVLAMVCLNLCLLPLVTTNFGQNILTLGHDQVMVVF
jgi:hypothetical protein